MKINLSSGGSEEESSAAWKSKRPGCWTSCLEWLKSVWEKDRLIIFILIAVVLGIVVGISINKRVQELQEPEKSLTIGLLGFPGELLMRMLKMLILPLIVCSLIVGLAGLGQQASGRIGRRALSYYLSTTLIAVLLGVILVLIIQPGKRAPLKVQLKKPPDVRPLDSFLDLMRNLFPDNIVAASFRQIRTPVKTLKIPGRRIDVNITALNGTQVLELTKNHKLITEVVNASAGINRTYYTEYKKVNVAGALTNSEVPNVIGLVLVAISIGIVAGNLEPRTRVFLEFVTGLNNIVMKLITVVMWYCPIGICSLLMVSFAQMDNISGTFESLGLLIMATILGLCIQAFVVYPLIYFAFVRKNPYVYMKGVAQALLTAFGTSSSAATLPVTIHCVETKNKIDERISRFMLPIGATVNMDGGAFYESLAVIYLAQVYNYDLGFGRYLAISLAATLASIGTAGVPSVAPVAILIVIQAAGLPVESVSLIFAVDWILDRFRTTVNVCGDCFGAGVVEHLSKKDLENHLEDQKENYQRQQKKEEKTELMNCNSLHVSENGQIDCRNDETKL